MNHLKTDLVASDTRMKIMDYGAMIVAEYLAMSAPMIMMMVVGSVILQTYPSMMLRSVLPKQRKE